MTTLKHVNEPVPVETPLPESSSADLKGSWDAIRRAAQRARQVAQQTGTDLIVMRAGQVVCVAPQSKGKPIKTT